MKAPVSSSLTSPITGGKALLKYARSGLRQVDVRHSAPFPKEGTCSCVACEMIQRYVIDRPVVNVSFCGHHLTSKTRAVTRRCLRCHIIYILGERYLFDNIRSVLEGLLEALQTQETQRGLSHDRGLFMGIPPDPFF